MRDLTGKTALVTGASGGIGLATAEGLAVLGFHVLMHGRSTAKLDAAVATIKGDVPDAQLTPLIADLSDLHQVDRLAQEVAQRAPKLDVLVNNAGLFCGTRKQSAQGHELTLAVNYLAPLRLTEALLPQLEAAAPSRIVMVTSRLHRTADLVLDDLEFTRRPYASMAAYAQSKLAMVVYANALARRLKDTRVTVNSVHPGVVGTNISDGLGPAMAFMASLFRPFLLSPWEGAKTSLHVATADDLETTSGEYFEHQQMMRPHKLAKDTQTANALATATAKLMESAPALAG
jgi:NAD(P)-dependent dehydrogenase (short-subunit alcohol dehydrogenase family)